jgi:hypothetical protein
MSFQKLEEQPEISADVRSLGTGQPNVAPITAISSAEQSSLDSSKGAQFERVLAELKLSSRRHGWFTAATTVLGSLLGIVVGTGILIVLAALIMEGKLPQIHIDFSPTAFAFNHSPGGKGVEPSSTISGITPLILLISTVFFAALMKRERAKLVSEISQYDNVRMVGPLINALYLRSKVTRTQAAIKLRQLLPKMRSEDKDLLDKEQRSQMNLYLGRSVSALLPDDNELSLAILKAYSAIGDESEVPVVRRIAQGKGRSGKDAEIRHAAQAYLDGVERRQKKLREPQILLRSTEAHGNDDGSLLRPVEGAQQSASETLLRPTE